MREEIFERVKKIIAKELEIDEEKIHMDSYIQRDLGADSLDVMNLTMRIEDEFDIRVSDEDLNKIQTVRDVVEYILNYKK